MLATWKNCKFLQQDKAPILIFEVEPVLDKLEKRSITGGPTCQPLGPNNSTTPADWVQTTAATIFPCPRLHHRHHSARSLCRHRPPPCTAIKGARRTRVSPFSPPSPLCHPTLCHRRAYCQAPHWCQLSLPTSRPSRPVHELWYSAAQLLDPVASTTGPCFQRWFASAQTAATVESSVRWVSGALAPQIGPPHCRPATTPFSHPSPVPACWNPPPPSLPSGRERAALDSPVSVEMDHQPKWLGQPEIGRPVSTRMHNAPCPFLHMIKLY
jgi:hypothetical protein